MIYEIPIEINQDYMSQSKLNNISDKLNLNLDSLITREEKIFELETQALNKLISRDDETNFQRPIKDSIKFYNDQSNISKKNESFTLIKNVAPQKPSRKPEIKDNKESNGFDLIKVSIVNKRPISPDIEDILNGVDEDQYMDRSFVFADEMVKQIEETKRLSSLDPSIANEYECGSVRSGSVYSKDISTCSSHNFKPLKPTNPFANDIINQNQSITPSYESFDMSKFNQNSYETKEKTPIPSIIKRTKPEIEVKNIQPMNVEKLKTYNYKYEIESSIQNEGAIKVKDISIIDLNIPPDSTTNVQSTTQFFINDNLDQKYQPQLVKHLYRSEEELTFKNDIDETYRSNTLERKSQEKGIFSVFTRIFEVIRTPFSRNNDKLKKKSASSNIPVNSAKQKEYKQSLLSNVEDEFDDDGLNTRIFTVDKTIPVGHQLPWENIKESTVRIQSSSSKIQAQKDITPKEVAKMRKTMDGKKPWKCCLF